MTGVRLPSSRSALVPGWSPPWLTCRHAVRADDPIKDSSTSEVPALKDGTRMTVAAVERCHPGRLRAPQIRGNRGRARPDHRALGESRAHSSKSPFRTPTARTRSATRTASAWTTTRRNSASTTPITNTWTASSEHIEAGLDDALEPLKKSQKFGRWPASTRATRCKWGHSSFLQTGTDWGGRRAFRGLTRSAPSKSRALRKLPDGNFEARATLREQRESAVGRRSANLQTSPLARRPPRTPPPPLPRRSIPVC